MILSAKYIISSPDVAKCLQTDKPEYAFIGRSNVGKSSLINMLCNDKTLAKTSQKPGKTLLINHFIINEQTKQPWYLVDLPGYGYARAGKSQRDNLRRMIERYCLLRAPLVNLFVLIDSRHDAQQIDLDFINWLGEQYIPFAIVFTKADKVGREKIHDNVERYKQKLTETWDELPPMFITSAETKQGRDELIDYIELLNAKINEPEIQ